VRYDFHESYHTFRSHASIVIEPGLQVSVQ